MFPDTLKKF